MCLVPSVARGNSIAYLCGSRGKVKLLRTIRQRQAMGQLFFLCFFFPFLRKNLLIKGGIRGNVFGDGDGHIVATMLNSYFIRSYKYCAPT